MNSLLVMMAEPVLQTASNGIVMATVVLYAMVAAVVFTFIAMLWGIQHPPRPRPQWIEYLTPALIVIGLVAAGYLAYIELTHIEPVCGPIKGCDTVNNSSYAKLFGVLPVGLMGLIGYVAILTTWLWGRFRSDRLASSMPLILFGLALFGTLFSIYLTYVEVYVIFAVCIWCLTSAIVMTALLLLSINPTLQGMDVVADEISHSPQPVTAGSKAARRHGKKRK